MQTACGSVGAPPRLVAICEDVGHPSTGLPRRGPGANVEVYTLPRDRPAQRPVPMAWWSQV